MKSFENICANTNRKRNHALYFSRGVYRGVRLFSSSMLRHVRDEWLGKYFGPKPTVMQFLANNTCDSCSTMGSTWERGQDKRITPEELSNILTDSLFSRIQHVDITGGEPTLRPDLPEVGQVLIDSLPKLKSLQMITNALHSQVVIERTMALAQVTQAAGVHLDVSVSLDGIGEDHDRNRGVEGNSAYAVEVIKALKQNGLLVSIRCTLTPINCYGADDVLLWCEQNDIQEWTFRLGDSQRHQFTPEQRFHVIMFFDKLAHHRGVDIARRAFYTSLVGQLAFGLPRQAKCDWQTCGITLDRRGNIGYCSARSPILGCALEQSAWQVYREGIPERQRIVREHCDSCQHDLPGSLSIRYLLSRGTDIITRQAQQRRDRLHRRPGFTTSTLPADHSSPHEWKHVLITGWYGTETAGDKAILAEVLHFIKTCSAACQVTLTTLDRKVSQQTRSELAGLQGSTLVEITKGHDPALIESVDAVIIGGGPLMEIPQMEYIWRMFSEANRQRKARIVFGCGVGPLHTERMRQVTTAIIRMATAGFLRDKESHEYASTLAPGNPLGYACDPALAYLRRWLTNHHHQVSRRNEPLRIAGLLRANTNEFVADLTKTELGDSNAKAAHQIARILETACKPFQAEANLLPMNAAWIGGDDRIFNRQVAGFFDSPEAVRVERRYLPLEALLQALHSADTAVAMRYHGHLFCMALGIPFLSIDYPGRPGKVHSLIQRIGYKQWSEEWREIDVSRAADRLQRLLEERACWSAYLQQQTDRLVTELNNTYTQVFDVYGGGSFL